MTRGKSTKGRTRKHPSSVRLLLVTGIPGTGKTTLGDYLRKEHRFRHLDFENLATLQRYLGHGIAGLERNVQALRRDGRDVVISWGFLPDVHLAYVLELRRLGFNWIWLDGDRGAARRVFLERGTVSAALLDAQLERIASLDLAALGPIVIDPFDAEGHFRSPAEIVAPLL